MQQNENHLETERKMTLRVGKSIRSTFVNMYESIVVQKNIKKTQKNQCNYANRKVEPLNA